MRKIIFLAVFLCLLVCFTGCSAEEELETAVDIESDYEEDSENMLQQETEQEASVQTNQDISTFYNPNTTISEVQSDPVFGTYGRLIFPVDTGYYSGDTLGSLRLTWYNNIEPDKTVEIVNYMKAHAEAGDTIFYDIYTEEEKASDPEKEDTGLFFFRGNPGEKFAICNAGGGFAYVEELKVDTDCYSLWGGSAGASMAAYLGTYGTAAFGEDELPKPGAVIMQYTGHSEYSAEDPPTYACVGKNDGIANWQVMQQRTDAMAALGIPTEFHAYDGLSHGFGLGTGTNAEGWLDDAVEFWEACASDEGGEGN